MTRVNLFSWGLIIRVSILVGLSLLLGQVFLSSNWIFTQIVIISLIALATGETLVYIHKTNRDVSRFLDALKYNELSTTFLDGNEPSKTSELHMAMENIRLEALKNSQKDERIKKLYFQALESTDKPVLIFHEVSGEILIQTNSVESIFGTTINRSILTIYNLLPGFKEKIETANTQAKINLSKDSFDYQLSEDLQCLVIKFKTHGEPYTLLLFDSENSNDSTSNFETWINFSKVISHEILNAISPIISLSETLQDQVERIEGNEKRKESMTKALNILKERGRSIQTYSEKYRTLHKLPEPELKPLIWATVINKSVQLYQDKLEELNVTTTTSGIALDDKFSGDLWQMEQVFSNLILNSLNAFKESNSELPEININVNANAQYYIISFSDNGPGIDKDNQSNIFVPFYTTREEGSGIGLSVIKQILWKHKAEIFLSDKGRGTTFIIRFPKL